MIANDGGASVSNNAGMSYTRVVLPISQMYGVSVDNQIPYNVMGNRQDGNTYFGPSNALSGGRGGRGGGISAAEWKQVGGCESGFATPDLVDNNIVWNGCFDGQISRVNMATGQSRMVSPWPDPTYGDRAVLRCSVGSAGDEDVLDAPDADLIEACAAHLYSPLLIILYF
jgi:hypothetical protein